MLFQGKDGELRLIDFGDSGTTYYLEVLFCEFSKAIQLIGGAPVGQPSPHFP